VLKARHPIVDQIGIEQLAIFVNHFFEQAMADGVHHAAPILALAEHRVNRFANISQGTYLSNLISPVLDRPLLSTTQLISQKFVGEPSAAFRLLID